jgi:hypothetical protein
LSACESWLPVETLTVVPEDGVPLGDADAEDEGEDEGDGDDEVDDVGVGVGD